MIFIIFISGLLGYDIEKLKTTKSETHFNADEVKRQRPSPQGSTADWEEMFTSDQHNDIVENLTTLLSLNKTMINAQSLRSPEKGQINSQSILFPYFRLILFTLHLLYEELKLNTVRLCELPFLANFLHQISADLKLQNYVLYYWKDFPDQCALKTDPEESQMTENDLIKINSLSVMSSDPVNIMEHFCFLLSKGDSKTYPFIKYVNPFSKNMLQVIYYFINGLFIFDLIIISDLRFNLSWTFRQARVRYKLSD